MLFAEYPQFLTLISEETVGRVANIIEACNQDGMELLKHGQHPIAQIFVGIACW